jgi:hypothetical protein
MLDGHRIVTVRRAIASRKGLRDMDSMLTSTGIIVLAFVAVAYGGTFLLRVARGGVPTNELQRSYFRAGHGHAAVFLILGLLIQVLLDHPGVPGWSKALASGVLFAAILMPAGFFLSVIGRDPQRPNGLRILIWLGAASLIVGLVSAGVGLIIAGNSA